MLPKGVAHQEKVRNAYTQGIPPHILAVFIGQYGDKEGSNQWEQDNRGKPGKSIGHHSNENKYLPVTKTILLSFSNISSYFFCSGNHRQIYIDVDLPFVSYAICLQHATRSHPKSRSNAQKRWLALILVI
ncbi:hypothetical protein [Argonema galeatum]|uniref:hypothetical protein n=1 Tax=Argonema galeatum TaxID=2942762 RepID=UPI00201136CC|nr:hypothetical protein [Argonema galeatum]MCL1468902.1 hypothetical protein [Argonema galeatum A003/A1]